MGVGLGVGFGGFSVGREVGRWVGRAVGLGVRCGSGRGVAWGRGRSVGREVRRTVGSGVGPAVAEASVDDVAGARVGPAVGWFGVPAEEGEARPTFSVGRAPAGSKSKCDSIPVTPKMPAAMAMTTTSSTMAASGLLARVRRGVGGWILICGGKVCQTSGPSRLPRYPVAHGQPLAGRRPARRPSRAPGPHG